MNPVSVIGMGLSPEDFTLKHRALIDEADVLVGGERHLSCLPEITCEKKVIDKKLSAVVEFIRARQAEKRIVVLASGDPLFFGIGSYLVKKLGKGNVDIYPNITSVAAAFTLLKEPWHDASIVSLHGRELQEDFYGYFSQRDKVAILTDRTHTPAAVAGKLISCGLDCFEINILSRMGSNDRRIDRVSLSEAAENEYPEPNVVVLKRTAQTEKHAPAPLYPGMPDDAFEHERGLITKAEIRAVSIAKLRLESPHVLWDLGAGSGSVGIEASIFIKEGKIFSVEKNPNRVPMIERNRKKFGAWNLTVIPRDLTEGSEGMDAPDRIFIGGGGRGLSGIIREAHGFLKPSGIMVVNTVLIENMDAAIKTLEALGMAVEMTQLSVSRGHDMPYGRMLKAFNPVWVVTGTKSPVE